MTNSLPKTDFVTVVTEWLDDDQALRIPDTEWGRSLYGALRELTSTNHAEQPEHEPEEARPLDTTHRWGQRPYYEREEPGSNLLKVRQIPCCLNCLVDGFEDEPDGFAPCRRVENPIQRTRDGK